VVRELIAADYLMTHVPCEATPRSPGLPNVAVQDAGWRCEVGPLDRLIDESALA
jgi:hypothetical protein